jgi:hypothetical protein
MKASGGTGCMNEHVIEALKHSRKIMPLLMNEVENDYMCSELIHGRAVSAAILESTLD